MLESQGIQELQYTAFVAQHCIYELPSNSIDRKSNLRAVKMRSHVWGPHLCIIQVPDIVLASISIVVPHNALIPVIIIWPVHTAALPYAALRPGPCWGATATHPLNECLHIMLICTDCRHTSHLRTTSRAHPLLPDATSDQTSACLGHACSASMRYSKLQRPGR